MAHVWSGITPIREGGTFAEIIVTSVLTSSDLTTGKKFMMNKENNIKIAIKKNIVFFSLKNKEFPFITI